MMESIPGALGKVKGKGSLLREFDRLKRFSVSLSPWMHVFVAFLVGEGGGDTPRQVYPRAPFSRWPFVHVAEIRSSLKRVEEHGLQLGTGGLPMECQHPTTCPRWIHCACRTEYRFLVSDPSTHLVMGALFSMALMRTCLLVLLQNLILKFLEGGHQQEKNAAIFRLLDFHQVLERRLSEYNTLVWSSNYVPDSRKVCCPGSCIVCCVGCSVSHCAHPHGTRFCGE